MSAPHHHQDDDDRPDDHPPRDKRARRRLKRSRRRGRKLAEELVALWLRTYRLDDAGREEFDRTLDYLASNAGPGEDAGDEVPDRHQGGGRLDVN